MSSFDLLKRCRCGACGGAIGRPNLVTVDRRATWKYPRAGNVLTGEEGRAVAVACDACIEARRPITEVIEFRGEEVVYHALETLEPMPTEKTYVLVSGDAAGIQCLICGRTSWNPNDVANRYCGRCHHFHEDHR